VLAGLDAGLGWVPADGVPARLAAAVAGVALLVVVTGRPGSASAPCDRLDAASALALGLTVLAAAGAVFAPPDLATEPAHPAWLAVALLAGVAMVILTAPPRPARAARRPVRTGPAGPRRPGGDQSSTRSYR
jgi:hypothetical protein